MGARGTGATPPARTVRSITRPPMPSSSKKRGKVWVMVSPISLGLPERVDDGWKFHDFLVPAEGTLVGFALRVGTSKIAAEDKPAVTLSVTKLDGAVRSAEFPLVNGFSLHETDLATIPGDVVSILIDDHLGAVTILFAQATLLFKAVPSAINTEMVTDA